MVWHILDIIGTVAFVISGAIAAMEEKYDLFGVALLGFTTAFGGGVIRNLLLGIPVSSLWGQQLLLVTASGAALLMFFLPIRRIRYLHTLLPIFDAIGLAAFAVQGGTYAAVHAHHSVADIVVASTITGIGGGIVRDLLANRHPVVLQRDEFYAVWAVLDGLAIAYGFGIAAWQAYLLFIVTAILRMSSIYLRWRMPQPLFSLDRQA